MSLELHQTLLMLQRNALKRAILRATQCGAHEDAEILESVKNLIEELHALAPFVLDRLPPVRH